MKRVLIVVLLCASPCVAQTFKGNTIGMSLEEFKQSNKGQQIHINTGDPSKRVDKKLSQKVDTPLCTDTFDGFEGTEKGAYRLPGEIICNVSPGAFNSAAKTIDGMQMRQVLYHFYDGKLYRISLSFSTIQFSGVRSAFISKFGEPTHIADTGCQNAFGARWTAESVNWQISPTVTATLVEGCGNGPGQNAFDDVSGGGIDDSSIAPPHPTQKAADF
jgi:hypothetical protein